MFIDCSGDSNLAALTGAEFRIGREARAEFDDIIACGGWSMDDHHPADLQPPETPPTTRKPDGVWVPKPNILRTASF